MSVFSSVSRQKMARMSLNAHLCTVSLADASRDVVKLTGETEGIKGCKIENPIGRFTLVRAMLSSRSSEESCSEVLATSSRFSCLQERLFEVGAVKGPGDRLVLFLFCLSYMPSYSIAAYFLLLL